MNSVPSPSTLPPPAFSRVWHSYVLILIGAMVNVAAEVLLKRGANPSSGLLGFVALGSLWTWAGIASKILALLLWLWVLRTVPVGIAFALMTAPGYVLVPIGACVILHEPIALARWCGIALVVVGATLIIRPLAAAEEKL